MDEPGYNEDTARFICTAGNQNPDELIDQPGAPFGVRVPRWCLVLQRMHESPKEFEKLGLLSSAQIQKLNDERAKKWDSLGSPIGESNGL